MPPKATPRAAAIVHDDESEASAELDVAGLVDALGASSVKLPEQLHKYSKPASLEALVPEAQALKERKVLRVWAKRINQEVKSKRWPLVCALFEVGINLCSASKEKDKEQLAFFMPEVVKGTLEVAMKCKEHSVIMRVLAMVADEAMEELPKAVRDETMKRCAKNFHQVLAADWVDANAKQNCAEALQIHLTKKTNELADIKALCQAFKATTNPFLQNSLLEILRSLTSKGSDKPEAKVVRERSLKAMGEVLGQSAVSKWDDILANTKADHQQLTDFLIYYHSSAAQETAVLPCARMAVDEFKEDLTPEKCCTNFVSFTKHNIGVPIELLDIIGHSHPPGSRHVMLPIESLRGVNKVKGKSKDIQLHISERYATGGAKQQGRKKVSFLFSVDSERRMKEVIKGMMPHWKEQMEKGNDQRTQPGKRDRDAAGRPSSENSRGAAAAKRPRTSSDAPGAAPAPSLRAAAAAAAMAPPSPPAAKRRLDYEDDPVDDGDGDGDSSMDDMVDKLKKQIKQHDKKKRAQGNKELRGVMKQVEQHMKEFKDKARDQLGDVTKHSEEMQQQVEDTKRELEQLRGKKDARMQEMKEMSKKFDTLQDELDGTFADVLRECSTVPSVFEDQCKTFVKTISTDVNKQLEGLGRKIDKLHNKKELRTLLGAVISQLRGDGEDAESDGSA